MSDNSDLLVRERSLDSWQRTQNRFERRNAMFRKGRQKARVFCSTPFGARVTSEYLLEPLAEFIGGRTC